MRPDEQLEWEERVGRPAGVAAMLGAVLLIGSGVLNARVTDAREFERYLRFDSDPSLVILPNLVQAIGYVGVGLALWYLARATAARRTEMASPMRIMAVAGPAAVALSAILLIFGILTVASDVASLAIPHGVSDRAAGLPNLVANYLAGEDAAQDLQTDTGFYVASAYFSLAANLALGFALVLVSLNAMRAGLLSRFLGILGIIAGVLTVLFRGAGIIEAFWLVAVGVIFLDRWPNGRGPAWDEVEAIPWPSAMEQRAALAAEKAGDEEDEAEAYEGDEERRVRSRGRRGRGLRRRRGAGRRAAPRLEEAQEEAPPLGGVRQHHHAGDLVGQLLELERLLDERRRPRRGRRGRGRLRRRGRSGR